LGILLVIFIIQSISFEESLVQNASAGSSWNQTTEQDFNNGTLENVTVSAGGDVRPVLHTKYVEDDFTDESKIGFKKNITVDTIFGEAILEKFNETFGGDNTDKGHSVSQTLDGGYIVAGTTNSYGPGFADFWLIKTDEMGVEQWNKTFGGSDDDYGQSVQQTSDGGYIIVGSTNSYSAGLSDVWLVKTDSSGYEEWNNSFGGIDTDYGRTGHETSDGGYIIMGETRSYGAGGSDAWLIKTDSLGNEEWNSTLGSSSTDVGSWGQQTADGGYIMAGNTNNASPSFNALLIKTNETGVEQWNKTFGGTDYDSANSVQQSSDGGYIITGYVSSFGDIFGDVWLIKTDDLGVEQWNKSFGGGAPDEGHSINQTTDGGYIIAACTESYGPAGKNVWLIKTDSSGNEEWNKTFGGTQFDHGDSVRQTSDGGYIITGETWSYGPFGDAWLIKTNQSGEIEFFYGDLISTNLLTGKDVNAINAFNCTVSILSETECEVQFSQDFINWYDSGGLLNGWDILSDGFNSIDLSSMYWGEANFYYRMRLIAYNMSVSSVQNINVSYGNYSGFLESQVLNVISDVNWTTIGWNALKPPDTYIRFQLKSQSTGGNFVGFDGTSSTYYEIPGTDIWSGHDSDTWIQYKVYLNTTNPSAEPILQDVTISFNYIPVAPNLVGPLNNIITSDNTPLFSWQFSDLDGTQDGFQVLIDDDINFGSVNYDSGQQSSTDESWQFPVNTGYTNIMDGTWYWKVCTKDSDGDWSQYSIIWNFTVDTTPPNAFTPVASPAGWTNDTQPVITFVTTDDTSGVDHYEVSIDGGAFTPQSSPYTLPSQTDGTHNITVRAYDSAGNFIDGYVDVYIDSAPPNSFTPTANPSAWTNDTQPEISFSTTDGLSGMDHYEVKIDSGGFTTQSSPYTLPSQAEGIHNITVRAYDVAGNFIDGYVDVYIDITPPNLFTPFANPSTWTTNTQPEITFTTTDDLSSMDHYEVKIDSGGFTTQTSPYTIPPQTDGTHTVTVRAYDQAGNFRDGMVDVYIDTTSPEAFTPTANPSSWTNNNQPEITFSTTDLTSGVDHYDVKVDSGGFTTQLSPYTLPPQTHGTHTVTVRAYDEAGNFRDGAVNVYIDTISPDAFTPTANPSSWTNNTQPEITFSTTDPGSGVDHYEVKVDTGGFTTQVSPYTLPSQTDGTHTVTVRAYDLAGNFRDGTVDIYIDTAPPNAFIPTANPSSWTQNTQPVISFSTTDSASGVDYYEIKVDFGGFTQQTSPYTIPPQTDGTHTVTVRAYDLIGHFRDGTVDVYIDTTPPEAFTPTANPSSWTNNDQPEITFSTTDLTSGIDHYDVRVDSGGFITQVSPYTLPPQTDGIHTVTVRAYDQAGNFRDGAVSVYIDTLSPDAFTPTANPSGWTNNTQPEITFSSTDSGSGVDRYEVEVDLGGFIQQTSPYTLPSQTDGTHTVTVRAYDLAGNYQDGTVDIYIDTTPPDAFTPTADPSSWTQNTQPVISFLTTDSASGVEYYEVKVDSGVFTQQTSPYTLPSQTDGTHTVTVRAYDFVGNYQDGIVDVYIDTTPPDPFTPTANPDSWTNNNQPEITFSTTDLTSGVDHYEVKVDTGGFTAFGSPHQMSPQKDGIHNITVRAYDLAGNYQDGFVDVYIDTKPPNTFTPEADPSSWTNNAQPTIIFYTTDNTSGMNHYEVKIDNGIFSTQTSPYVLPSQEDGIHNITVRAYDWAGNYIEGYVFIYIDTTGPESFTPIPSSDSWTSNTQPQISFSAIDGLSGMDHYEISIDGESFTIQTSPYTLPPQDDGIHDITVRAFDNVGNYIDRNTVVYIDSAPPVITHTPVTSGYKDTSIIIAATVSDEKSGVASATLFFKKQNEVIYSSIQMLLEENIYSAEISAASVNTRFIEYYIKAQDNSIPTNTAYFGINGQVLNTPTTLDDIDIPIQGVDTIPPSVLAMSPDGSNVPIDSDIIITFSEVMIMNVTESAFSITPHVQGKFEWPGMTGTTLIFKPDLPLNYSREYTVTISADAKDLAYNNLEIKFEQSFLTQSGKEEAEKSFWDVWEPIITGLTVLASITVFLIGFLSIRRKRSKLRRYMERIEVTFNEHKMNPQKCKKELISLREFIKAEVTRGKLEESHFLILDKKIDDHLMELKAMDKGEDEAFIKEGITEPVSDEAE
jgi:hypothetical protein